MKNNFTRIVLLMSMGVFALLQVACSNNPEIVAAISAHTHIGRKTDKESGKLIGEGERFTIMNEGWVKAVVNMDDHFKTNEKDLLLHFDWVDPSGKSFYQKQKIVSKDSAQVSSAFSIAPELREAGKYKLRMFLYRQLVMEKEFELLPQYKSDSSAQNSIDLFTRKSKKTGKLLDAGTHFSIMKKGWVKAIVKLNKPAGFQDRELLYFIDWTDANDKILYRKHFDIQPNDTINSLYASWSIAPENRQAGDYKAKLYLFGELLKQKSFELLPPIDISAIKSNISFCSKVSKKTGKRSGFAQSFAIKKKAKVNACIDLKNCLAFENRELKFQIKWLDANGKSFYTKRFSFTPTKEQKSLKSAISISPKKRKKGTYKVQVLLFNEVVSEKEFKLTPTVSYKGMKASITLCRKVDKETGERVGVGTSFQLKKKRKVRAYIDLDNSLLFGEKELAFRIEWQNEKGKTFYSKDISLMPSQAKEILKSAISIYPSKRDAGKYKIKLYLFGELIKQQSFTLTE